MNVQVEQFSIWDHRRDINDPQSSSNEPSTNLHFNNSVPQENNVFSKLFGYWNRSKEMCSISYSKSRNSRQQSPNRTNNPTRSVEDNSQDSSTFVTSSLSREEIIVRRKSKVIALRKKKKLQEPQLKEQVISERVSEPNFFLDHASEDFPALCTARSNKKYKNNQNVGASETENSAECSFRKRNNGSDKSWKPKVKDPISIDIGQALQNKSEKSKVVAKKIDPTAQRNVGKGNILDSDNPQQNKGKVRPDKQRKPTKLKKQILIERNERKKQTQGEEGDNGSSLLVPLNSELTQSVHKPVEVESVEEEIHTPHSDFSDEISLLLVKCALLKTDGKSSPGNYCKDLNNQQHDEKFESSKRIHSRKFREYCTNCLTEEVITSVCALLEKLAYFQDRIFTQNPIRAQAKRRYVAGMSQTNKYLLVKKVKLLVIAPDLEKNSGEGGLDGIIRNFKNETDIQGVPCVFGPKRNRLGKAVFKNALVSCVAVLSYEGAEEQFFRVLEALNVAKLKYQALVNGVPNSDDGEDCKNIEEPVGKDYISADEVTSSLLAVLKGDQSPADKLLNAIHETEWPTVDT